MTINFLERIQNTGAGTLLSTTTGVDLTSAGTTNLYTVPTGKVLIPTQFIFKPTTVTGFISVATAGVGIVAGEIDIIAAAALTGLNATNLGYFAIPLALVRIGSAGEIIKLGVDVGAIATTFTVTVYTFGILV